MKTVIRLYPQNQFDLATRLDYMVRGKVEIEYSVGDIIIMTWRNGLLATSLAVPNNGTLHVETEA